MGQTSKRPYPNSADVGINWITASYFGHRAAEVGNVHNFWVEKDNLGTLQLRDGDKWTRFT
jgi:hypothetical protein